MESLPVGTKLAIHHPTAGAVDELVVEEVAAGRVLGQSVGNPAFAACSALFLAFEELAENQCFSHLDALEARIEELGLFAISDRGQKVPVAGLQIWSTGGASFVRAR